MAQELSRADQTYLTQAEQARILELKEAWAKANAAGDRAGMASANRQAEAIRAQKGYQGGSDGSGNDTLGTGGGKTASEVQDWVDTYRNTNYRSGSGWVNGYSTEMNLRSMANYIRQQMQANSDAWTTTDAAGKSYLHDQNLQLAQLLEETNGGAKSTFNETLGRWETDNANLGYGYNVGQYNDLDWYKNFYGMTDEQIEAYRNDQNRYHNFVDQRIVRNWVDESGGYTGVYAQFANGPYGQLLSGTDHVPRDVYVDVQGDGFGREDYVPVRDAQGNIVPQAPAMKNNNTMTDYTRQFAAYVEDGVIQPSRLPQGGGTSVGTGSIQKTGTSAGADQSQYNQIQAQAAANRQTVASAQAKLAADTNQQIIQLRAQGEYEKANDLLEISQTYLLKLLELEQWASEYQLSTQKFQASMDQWQQEYLLKVLKAIG